MRCFMLFFRSDFKLNLSNILSLVVEILFFAALSTFIGCTSENQKIAYPSQELEETIHHTWEGIKKERGSTKDQVSQCQILDSLARKYPYQFADFIVAANAMASMKNSEYKKWSYFLNRGEKAYDEYKNYLSDSLILRTTIAIKFERCRITDSQGDLEEAIDCYKQVWESLPSHHDDAILKKFQYVIPVSIAWVNVEIGNYVKALDWLRKAELNVLREDNLYLGILYNLKGRVNEMLKNKVQAEEEYKKALASYAQIKEDKRPNHYYETYLNLTDLLLEQSRNEEALMLLKGVDHNSEITDRSIFLIDYQFSKIYYALNSLEKSVEHGNLALECSAKVKTGNFYWRGRILESLARSLAAQGRFEAAIDSINSGIQHLGFKVNEKKIVGSTALKASNTKLDLLKSLILKSNILESYAQQNLDSKSEFMKEALESFMLTIELIKILRAGYQDDEVKEYLSEQSFSVFESALKIAFFLIEKTQDEKYLEIVFSIMETSKSLSLLEKLKDTKAKKSFGLPKKILAEVDQINFKIAREEQKITKIKESKPKTKIQYDNLFDFRAKREKLIESIKQKFPEYYELKYDVSPVKIAEVKRILEVDETFVEYFFGEELVYVFSISKSETSLNSFRLTNEFKEHLEQFISFAGIQTNLDDTKEVKQFNEIGYKLYEKLLKNLAIKTEKLIIVPDGPLNFLPFAALPINNDYKSELSELTYLVEEHVIKNNFSASVLYQQYLNKKKKKEKSKPLLVIAPKEFPNNSKLPSDLNLLEIIFNDDIQIERAISKKALQNLLSEGFQNVFFFTHASGAIDQPYIQLSDDTLYLSEIYATPISTNLVLLGACETGLGQHIRGEGVHSLARGFAYQNVPNIIMTLWNVNGGSTSSILTSLVKHHLGDEKMPLPEALQEVQIEAINSSQKEEEPFYWAGFVIMGGISTVNEF